MTHGLKTWPEYFQAVSEARKKFEYRDCFDRVFSVGDTLALQEWDPITKKYTGREVQALVTYILKIEPGNVIMSIDVLNS